MKQAKDDHTTVKYFSGSPQRLYGGQRCEPEGHCFVSIYGDKRNTGTGALSRTRSAYAATSLVSIDSFYRRRCKRNGRPTIASLPMRVTSPGNRPTSLEKKVKVGALYSCKGFIFRLFGSTDDDVPNFLGALVAVQTLHG